jgi:HD-like signal output (HDOD) protein
VVRIVLSGQHDREMTLQTVQVAHQQLLKPCDVSVLKNTISKALALNNFLCCRKLQRVAARIDSLPSMPAIYHQLMDEMHTAYPSIEKVGQIISHDFGMSTKILQMVNSAFFGLYRKISSPTEAVMLLGMETIKALVLSVKIFSQFNRKLLSFFNVDALWNHSLSTGVQAQFIGQKEQFDKQQTSDAFLAGLLHDVGKLILATNFTETYRIIHTKAKPSPCKLWQVEKAVFGTTHAEIGAYLMGLWGFDNTILEAIAFHHQPSGSRIEKAGPLLAVHVSNALQNPPPATEAASPPYDLLFLEKLEVMDHIHIWEQARVQSEEAHRHG